ncbi:MAG: hypothetical protein HY290_29685 [Planctomycetia bacterium]|nr:hypothetical protein [Planctomycetia bacterium]
MRFRAAKWIAMSVVSIAAFACASISTEADACCGFFSSLFGCGGCGPRCCRPAYPCAPAGCPTGTYYGPVVYNNCAPCATGCSPCATGNCSTGNCTVGSSTGSNLSAPAPDADPKFTPKQKTFIDDHSGSSGSGLGQPGDLPDRTKTDPDAEDGARRLQNRDGNTGFERPINADGTESGDADSGSSSGTRAGSSKSDKSKKGPPASKPADDTDGDTRHAPRISIDEKVAWRAAPVRTRMTGKTQTASARLVRLPAYPKSEWLPVDGDSKIAKN